MILTRSYTEIFGFTRIVFNGIPGLTEYFWSPKLIFANKIYGFNEFPGLTEKMACPKPFGKSENLYTSKLYKCEIGINIKLLVPHCMVSSESQN